MTAAARGRFVRLRAAVDGSLNPPEGKRSLVMAVILLLITANIIAIVLETHGDIATRHSATFDILEWVSASVFGIEYILRLWVAPLHPSGRYRRPWLGRIRYALTPMALIDLGATLPTFLTLLIPLDAGVMRMMRIFRLLRIFKVARYGRAIDLVFGAIARKKEELVLTSFLLTLLVVLAATAMYLVEGDVQPDVFGSIPVAMWWTVVTLTTVGYGDVVPVTEGGKLLAGMVAISGVIFVALPSGILASGFLEQLEADRRARRRKRRDARRVAGHACPHCGGALADADEDEED